MPLLHVVAQKMLAQDAVFSYEMRKLAEFKKHEDGKLGDIIFKKFSKCVYFGVLR